MASNVRVGGSGLTVAYWNGNTPLAYLQAIQDTAPAPVAQAVPVQSITDAYPSEIVTALAVGPGTLRLTFYETLKGSVWQQLPGYGNTHSLLDIFREQVAKGSVTFTKVIRDPTQVANQTTGIAALRTKVYHNCMITDVDDGEQIQINTMVMPKGITVMYTNATVV